MARLSGCCFTPDHPPGGCPPDPFAAHPEDAFSAKSSLKIAGAERHAVVGPPRWVRGAAHFHPVEGAGLSSMTTPGWNGCVGRAARTTGQRRVADLEALAYESARTG